MVIFVLAILGACMGSFVNALVWRVHEQSRLTKKSQLKQRQELSVVKGRSMCPDCRHELGVADLLPIISWVSLRGRCRYCKSPIGWQYPLVEAITAMLFICSYVYWPFELDSAGLTGFIAWLGILTGFVALTVYDIRWMLLPNRILHPLYALGLVFAVSRIVGNSDVAADVVMLLVTMAVTGGLFHLLFEMSQGRWIGGGDVRLGYLIGLLLLRPELGLLMLFTASLLGTLMAMPQLFRKKLTRFSHIPFGPFLMAATMIVLLFGQSLVDWYQAQFLYL